jgi:hypothetical protein
VDLNDWKTRFGRGSRSAVRPSDDDDDNNVFLLLLMIMMMMISYRVACNNKKIIFAQFKRWPARRFDA